MDKRGECHGSYHCAFNISHSRGTSGSRYKVDERYGIRYSSAALSFFMAAISCRLFAIWIRTFVCRRFCFLPRPQKKQSTKTVPKKIKRMDSCMPHQTFRVHNIYLLEMKGSVKRMIRKQDERLQGSFCPRSRFVFIVPNRSTE